MSKKVLKRKNVTITLEPDGFSIHTFELSIKLTKSEWKSCKHRLYEEQKLDDKNWIYQDKQYSGYGESHTCMRYSGAGIRIRLERTAKAEETKAFYVRMVINPKRLIDPKSGYLGILPPEESRIELLEKTFETLFRNTPFENNIRAYYLTRVDLCTNIRCENKKVFRELVRLLRKTATPAKYQRLSYRHRDKKKANQYNKHYIRIACDSQELVIYDKTYQLHENGLIVNYEKLPVGVLRVEVHYCRGKLKAVENKLRSEDSLTVLWALMQESKSRIVNIVEKCYPNLPYVSCEEANAIIERSACKAATKERMRTLLEQMQRKQSLDAAFRWMEKRGIKTSDMTALFAKLDINPIPLRKGFAAKRMPSLPELLHKVEDGTITVELEFWKWK